MQRGQKWNGGKEGGSRARRLRLGCRGMDAPQGKVKHDMFNSLFPYPLNVAFLIVKVLVEEALQNSLREVDVLCHLSNT